MTEQEHPKCDACGKPATSAAQDIIKQPDSTGGMKSRPIGGKKYGCDEHPVQSETHTSSGLIFLG